MINDENTVAHYTKLENLEKILKEKNIRFSFVKKFDDPRERSLGWISTLGYGHEIDLNEWTYAQKLKDNAGSQINIFCTCSRSNNNIPGSCPIESSSYGKPRMWSQYGGNSKGFCIVFDREKLNKQITQNTKYLISGHVTYHDWLHMVNGGSTIEYGQGIDLKNVDIFDLLNNNMMLQSIYFKKSIDWKDENEFRWLLFSEEAKPVYVSIDNCVASVVLGCDFPVDKMDIASTYCKSLNCQCYILQYDHPKYLINQLK